MIMINKMRSVNTILLVSLLCLYCNTEVFDPDLAEGFRDPGKEARPRAYWNWLNGDVSRSGLTRDLEEAKDKGLGGLLMWDTEAMRNPDGFVPAGPPFMGPESVDAIHHAINEAKRLDLDLGLVCASGWNSGGSWVPPEMASKNLFSASVVITGPGQVRQKLPFPDVPRNCPKGEDGMPKWYREVAVLAWPESEEKRISDLSDIVNLSDKFQDGELVWSPPAGKWQVVRFVCSNNGQKLIAASPNSKGFFIDFLDPEATRFHFEYIINKLGLPKGGDPNSSLKSLDDDSMELHEGIQWTTKFREWFQKHHGYDPVPWLPVLMGWIINDEDESGRFQYDYKKTVSDLLIYSHYTTGTEICAEYGLTRTAEAGGPGPPIWGTCPVDALKALGNTGIPRGEFWMGNPRHIFLIKEIASAAHIYGKTYVDAESWTTWRRWRDGPFTRKLLVDRAFCEGLNRVTYHGFSHSPPEEGYPGRSYHAGVDMNPKVVWWPKARPFMDYLGRCCHMLQQGKFVADVAYYYGDQAPNFWPFNHFVPEKPMIEGLGAGYDYDVVNTDVILNRMSVKDGMIILPDGMSYRILVLPEQKDIPLEVLRKLVKMVSEGATIIGPKPSDVPGFQDYEYRTAELRELADNMWGECNGTTIKVNRYGKGNVVWGYTPQQWLELESVGPDFICRNSELVSGFDFIHRRTEILDIYFVRNKTTKPVTADCLFRVKNRTPQIWDPTDGSIDEQFVYKSMDGGTSLPLDLPPGGSVFVVFDKNPATGNFASINLTGDRYNADLPLEQIVEATNKTATINCWQNGHYLLTGSEGQEGQIEVNDLPAPLELDGDWIVEFDPGWGAPAEVKLPELISWTDHADEGVKYYSGTGVYNKKFDIPADWLGSGRQVHLDLGNVREVAEIFVNGQSAGVVWKPPFRVDITPFLTPGNNELKIEVMNLWINRLSGDMNLPDHEKFTRTNIRSDGATRYSPAEPWHAQPAGLLGPVRLLASLQVSVNMGDTFGPENAVAKDPPGLHLKGNRFFTLATVVRVHQIEVSRDVAYGPDESIVHTPAEARIFRETIARAWPGARITWAFSWLALKDDRPDYRELKELVVSYHKKYGDEITFIPGAYFANMYNSREQVNRDLNEGLQMVSEMVGNGYRPNSVIAGFLAAENLRYLAEDEDIHVCQGNIWSQHSIDNGDGEGSISYPYYPSSEHFCKPARGKEDFIDIVNLDGWTVDFVNATYPGVKFINGERCGSRQGVGPIETVIRLGTERGTKEMLSCTSAHFDTGFELNDFAWITCIWELSLVEARKIYGYQGRNGMEGMEIWLSEMLKRWPDANCITHGEFGMIWREHFKNNDDINYRFVQRGSGVCGSETDLEVKWYMNEDFRLAFQRNWKENSPWKVIDFTRYDLKAQEPDDPEPGEHVRNWSLMNRLNQKGIRPQDKPIDISELNAEEQDIIKKRYPELIKN